MMVWSGIVFTSNGGEHNKYIQLNGTLTSKSLKSEVVFFLHQIFQLRKQFYEIQNNVDYVTK